MKKSIHLLVKAALLASLTLVATAALGDGDGDAGSVAYQASDGHYYRQSQDGTGQWESCSDCDKIHGVLDTNKTDIAGKVAESGGSGGNGQAQGVH